MLPRKKPIRRPGLAPRSSRPSGPPPKREYSHHPSQLWRRLYYDGWQNDNLEMEKLVGYQPGGHHPIHLGDELCNGRFRVIHKLGYGGSSIVWLCRDQSQSNPTYVAVKILVAHLQEAECRELRVFQDQNLHHLSRYFCLPKEQFTSESPNGTHLCLVLPVLGPTVNHAAWIFNEERDPDGIMLRQVSRSLVEAVASLHSYSICHAGKFS